MSDMQGSVSMKGSLRVSVKRGGPWYRRAYYFFFIDWWKGGRPK